METQKEMVNAGYLAMSALQKACRRNDVARALIAARLLWEWDPWRAFRRLVTVLFEDCGRDYAAHAAFMEMGWGRAASYKSWG